VHNQPEPINTDSQMQAEQQPQVPTINTSDTALADAYGVSGDKRSLDTTAATEPPQKRANTVKVILEDDDEEPPVATQKVAAKTSTPQAVRGTANEEPDTKFDWRNLTDEATMEETITMSDALSKGGDYLNVNPNSAAYSAKFNKVECGWILRFQTPPLVCTTGLRNSDKYPGSWSALLAGGDNFAHTTEVGDFIEFCTRFQKFLNDKIIANGESIFLKTAERVDQENAKTLAKNPNAKVSNPYKNVPFVQKGPSNPQYKMLWDNGAYTREQYNEEMRTIAGEFLTSYEDKVSLNTRAYPKKDANGVRDNYTPDVIIISPEGQVEAFNPTAPYCQKGKTSWEAMLKVSIKWYDGQFRLYLVIEAFRYLLNGGGQSNAGLVFSDKDGNVTRVTND